MLLKSLELQGFKTFPDKTKLTFDTGITAVVGPNGSGKSNISDAIRWVLGEQSPKSLRCSKMEDVVFNGSDKRKRQGFAEVTLTIENEDRFLNFDGDEVAVTRRYYRSGDSEYLINKSTVRLRDIHELFMDTGLGRDGYSMIGQGKIDSIVASKSEDRREIFEEAAGISRYRYRKAEAERKLAQTEENLIRLRDIVTELENRVGPLKIQSAKAENFLKYSQEKKGLEIAIWLDTLNKSSAVLKEQEDKISIARNQHEEVEAVLTAIAEETEQIYNSNGEFSSKIDNIRHESAELSDRLNHFKSQVSVYANDILHNNQNINRLQLEIDEIDKSQVDIKANVNEKKKQIEQLSLTVEQEQKQYDKTADELNNITVNASRNSDEFQNLNTTLNGLNSQYADCRVNIVTVQASIEEISNRSVENARVLTENKEALSTLESMNVHYKNSVQESEKNCTQKSNSISGLELKLNSRRKKADDLKHNLDKLNLDIQEKLRRAKILEDLEKNMEGFAYSVKLVMQNSKSGRLGGIHGPVSRVVSVPSQYAVAIETALGGAMQNIVTTTEEDAKNAINFLKQNKGGRATFLPINTISGRDLRESGLNSCYGFVGIASDLCNCDDKYKNILSSLLGRIVVAQDLNVAVSIAKKYSYRFKVVSLDGQVVNAGGSLTGGSFANKSGLLSRSAEIENIRKTAAEITVKAKAEEEKYDAVLKELTQTEYEVNNAKLELTALLQDKARIQAESKACTNEYNNSKIMFERLQNEIENADLKTKQLEIQRSQYEAELSVLSEKIKQTEKLISDITGSRADLSEQREKLTVQMQNTRLRIVTAQKDIDSLNNEISLALNSDSTQLIKRRELTQNLDLLSQQNSKVTQNIENIKSQIKELDKQIAEFKNQMDMLNNKRNELEKRSAVLRQSERDKTSERENIGRELARLEERKLNLQNQYDGIISKLWEEYELTVRQAQEISEPIENISDANKRLNELKQKIKALGSVNVAAIEEYKEVSERYEFISAQVNDVEKSKKEIEALINKLTGQMKEVFVESFSEINKNFTTTFKELFGGGTASLSLAEPDKILTSGIDIIVHPPGKIVVHLEALSGGEKALVAISLYFAIMKVRPAPFCVLDEIEAALDDVNVERFAQYMRRMTNRTQFICITHRRGTMEEADVLYGVTMQDEGISKLLELRASEVAAKLGL